MFYDYDVINTVAQLVLYNKGDFITSNNNSETKPICKSPTINIQLFITDVFIMVQKTHYH